MRWFVHPPPGLPLFPVGVMTIGNHLEDTLLSSSLNQIIKEESDYEKDEVK